VTKGLVISAALLLVVSLPRHAKASTFDFSFSGAGVSGTVALTYGLAADGKYSDGFDITAISGTFSDSNIGIFNASIGPLVAISPTAPDPTNLLAPDDFSKFAVASGLPAQSNGAITYDNLFYPAGSPATASDYPLHGGFLDIYGILFDIGGGKVVDLWSNGTINGVGPFDYGVAVATSATSLDYVSGGVSIAPEPGAFTLLAIGLLGILVWRRRTARQNSL
jgi:PEP-CTERM motif